MLFAKRLINVAVSKKHAIMTKAADVTFRLANGSRAVSRGTCLVNVDIQQYSGTVEAFGCHYLPRAILLQRSCAVATCVICYKSCGL